MRAACVLHQVNGVLICDKKVLVRPCGFGDAENRINIFVKNLQPDVDQEKLTAMFQQFGTIMSAVVIKDHEVWNSIFEACVKRCV